MGKSIKYLCCLLMFALLTGSTVIYGDDTPPPAAAEAPPQSTDTATDNPLSGNINVTFNVTPRQANGKLYFDVETNLPDEMRFMCAIRDEIGVVYRTGSTMERLMTEVDDGRMMVGPFPFEDRPFPSGEYTLYINSYSDEYQPESVIEIIGEEGVNLTGRNVFYGMVFFGKEFMITGTEG